MRNPELDSMRGLAALAVVAYHSIAVNSASLAGTINLQPVDGIWSNLLAYSPLRMTWLGAESVWFFFILSGLVLTRSAMRPDFSWNAYYPSRLVRLYLPVAAAIALGFITFLLPHIPRPGLDPGLPTSYPIRSVLSDLILVGGTSNSMGVLWSLQWEVIFSLLLPIYVLLARSRPIAASIVAAAMLAAGWVLNNPAASFLPMFFIGSLLAQKWEWIEQRLERLNTPTVKSTLACAAVLVLAVGAITSYYLVGPHVEIPYVGDRVTTLPLVLVGIVAIIVLGHMWAPLRAALRIRPLLWLGKISFSVYLVHLPIVVAAAFLLPNGATTAVISIAASLIIAAVFYSTVERPAHRLSRRLHSSIKQRDLESRVPQADRPDEPSAAT